VKDAGLTRIDNLITTHWHGDHFGGMANSPRVSRSGISLDHGPNVQPGAAADEFLQKNLSTTATQRRSTSSPHQYEDSCRRTGRCHSDVSRTDDQDGSSGAGGANSYCASFKPGENNAEDPMSVGTHVTFGKFRTIHLGESDEEQGIRADVSH
jgi:beta-lactamase superfamily II metal-dependent hydrolase